MKFERKNLILILRQLPVKSVSTAGRMFRQGRAAIFTEEFEHTLDLLLSHSKPSSTVLNKLNLGTTEQRILKKLAYFSWAYKGEIGTIFAGVALTPKMATALALVVIALFVLNTYYTSQENETIQV